MPDYASILRRSISALSDSSSEMREAVYQRARAALARQLTTVDPPLSSREIEAQHQDLEDAVARIEADYSAPAEPIDQPETWHEPERFHPAPEPGPPVTRTPTPLTTQAAPDYDRRAAQDYDPEDDEEEDYEEDERRSRAPLLVGLAVLVLVLVGAAAYAYAERDRIAALFDFSGPSENVADAGAAPGTDPPENPAAAPDIAKRPDRLTNGTDAPPEPEPPAELAAVPDTEPGQDGETIPGAGETDAVPLGEEQAAASPDPGQSLVEQRAIYYFQGAEGTPGQATNGNVTWAQITRESGPAVQATLRLAGQPVTTTVTIYKNSDSNLPASHLVEVQFSGQIGPTPVQRVPALVIKQTEQARGQPLTGAAVPVTNELFWIALSDDQEQVARNLQLLREGSWFDIPILFNDGTRALLTFEKGIPGDKVFETAMAAWTPS